ncbi:MAG: alpha/beta fold hydrolase [Clostridia bacterium]|nr:alpha/beta fold hydrolase [Clostridia bacterium]
MPHIDLASEGGRQIPVEYRLPADARRVCIIAHGFASSKESATAQMMLDHLEKLGLGAFAFDFPCHGASSAPWQQLTVDACLADLRQVEAFARTRASEAEVCYFGSSFGAYITILHLCTDPGAGRRAFLRCAAVDMDHAFDHQAETIGCQLRQLGYALYDTGYGPQLRLSGAFFESLRGRSVFDLPLPPDARLEMIHGLSDDVVDPAAARAYAAAAGCRINLIPGADHRIATPEGIQTLLERTAYFFA